MTEETRRRRRSSEEVRSLLLEAAVELFGERGYAGATTRDIAERAGVSATILFRNFGGKEQLFEAAVLEPIADFLQSYTEGWLSAPIDTADSDQMMRSFVTGIYALAQEHRQLLLAATRGHLGPAAQPALARLEHMAATVAKANGYRYDPAISIRAAVAMVLSLSLYEDDLFATGSVPPREQIIDEATDLLLRGLTRKD